MEQTNFFKELGLLESLPPIKDEYPPWKQSDYGELDQFEKCSHCDTEQLFVERGTCSDCYNYNNKRK